MRNEITENRDKFLILSLPLDYMRTISHFRLQHIDTLSQFPYRTNKINKKYTFQGHQNFQKCPSTTLLKIFIPPLIYLNINFRYNFKILVVKNVPN